MNYFEEMEEIEMLESNRQNNTELKILERARQISNETTLSLEDAMYQAIEEVENDIKRITI